MARRPRADTPGSWHHVINRGIAKRPYFESRSDKRYFLARLASEVRAGRIEVHAFCLMTTHFHLLLRSPIGEMSEAMRRIQSAYARYFNRRRGRDGPLIRARFFSKLVDTDSYRRTVVRYIDANATRAGVTLFPGEDEFGSARDYIKGPIPIWLSSDWVVPRAIELSGAAEFDTEAYLTAFGPRHGEDLESLSQLIELRMASSRKIDALDDLVGKTPIQVRRWMIRKARLADGMEIGLPVCGPSAVGRALKQHLSTQGDWLVGRDSGARRGSEVASSGLLRDLCCLPLTQVASMGQVTPWKATKQIELHRASVADGGEYAAMVSEIAHRALAETIPLRK